MNDFFSTSFFKKKGVYSQTTFALLLILYFSLMLFAYFYYDQGIENYSKLQIENSQLDALIFIQQGVLRSIVLENQSVFLGDYFQIEDTDIIANSSYIEFTSFTDEFEVKNKYFLNGILFCDSYNLYFQLQTVFIFNSSCIQVIVN